MSRINTNVVSLLAQRNLAVANASVNKSLERLSTGLKINRGADDPAGLIASERLRSEKVSLTSAISNSVRATNFIGTAEGSLNEINGLLLDIQGMVDTAANSGGMTTAEIAANQLLVDEAISSISRTSATTQFNGKKLLDGTLGFNTNSLVSIDSVSVNQATFEGGSLAVSIAADATAAAKGTLTLLAARIGTAEGLIRVEGNKGVANVNITTTMTADDIAAALTAVKDLTGVEAANVAGDVVITSAEYGATQYVKTSLIGAGDWDLTSGYGTDADVTSVNGSSEGISVAGLNVTVKRAGLDLSLVLDSALDGTGTFNIEQGGAKFQIGPEINTSNQVTIGISNVGADALGEVSGDYLSSLKSGGDNDLASGNFSTAASVVAKAIDQVSSLRGRMGALQKNTLEASIRSLGTTLENITSAESTIRDTDFAAETANLTRAQILSQAGTSVLAMANAAPQNVLALLGGR